MPIVLALAFAIALIFFAPFWLPIILIIISAVEVIFS